MAVPLAGRDADIVCCEGVEEPLALTLAPAAEGFGVTNDPEHSNPGHESSTRPSSTRHHHLISCLSSKTCLAVFSTLPGKRYWFCDRAKSESTSLRFLGVVLLAVALLMQPVSWCTVSSGVTSCRVTILGSSILVDRFRQINHSRNAAVTARMIDVEACDEGSGFLRNPDESAFETKMVVSVLVVKTRTSMPKTRMGFSASVFLSPPVPAVFAESSARQGPWC